MKLTGPSLEALEWLKRNGPALRKDWRNAGIQAITLATLQKKELVRWYLDESSRAVFVITGPGRELLQSQGLS